MISNLIIWQRLLKVRAIGYKKILNLVQIKITVFQLTTQIYFKIHEFVSLILY